MTAPLQGREVEPHPVDTMPPWRQLVPMSVQHLVVMIATPISSVFLLSATLDLSAGTTKAVLCATLLLCGIGSILQSTGWLGLGAKLPFVMLPGGAAVVLFLQIATEYGPATATGSVLITAVVGLLLAPVASRVVRFIPPVVIATMIVVIGVNLVKVAGSLIVGPDNESAPMWSAGLAAITIVATVVFQRVLPNPWRRISVLAGMAVGTIAAGVSGHLDLETGSDIVQLPDLVPFGTPHFDLIAALPLLIFSIGSMAEATGQTVLNAEVVGKEIDKGPTVGRTIRGDAFTSLLAGFVGGQTMITSGENIGIVRLTGVRSRYVTAVTGALLVLIAFIAPIGAVVSSLPGPVVGGTAAYMFAMIVVTGLKMYNGISMSTDATFVPAVAGLVAGLLPILAPTLYLAFPTEARLLLSSGVTMSALVGGVVAALFALPAIRRR